MSHRELSTLDLSEQEQEHVRSALLFLHLKLEGWKPIAKLLKFEQKTLADIVHKRRNVNASLAFRVARLVGIGIDDILAGKYPEPGVCPRCGHKDTRATSGTVRARDKQHQ